MLERLLILVGVCALGFFTYQGYTFWQKRRIGAQAATDPLLTGVDLSRPTIVFFTTPECVACRTVQVPAFEDLQQHINLQIIRVDAEADPQAASRWGVFSVPTTFVLDRQGHPSSINRGVAGEPLLRQQLGKADPNWA
ncbi:MAG: thioredoxin family protein [Anaerolineae bacterium]|nr:thioredoxin family protein [Anaerolineae bacterium]